MCEISGVGAERAHGEPEPGHGPNLCGRNRVVDPLGVDSFGQVQLELDIPVTGRSRVVCMRIGQIAEQAGTTTKAIRFYESEGLVPAPSRGENGYREYGPADLQRIRMLVGLRSLDLPLEPAAELATLCVAGHCDEASVELRDLVVRQRADLARRLSDLSQLDDRLALLERHLASGDKPDTAVERESVTRPERRLEMLSACECTCGHCCGCEACGCGCACSSHRR